MLPRLNLRAIIPVGWKNFLSILQIYYLYGYIFADVMNELTTLNNTPWFGFLNQVADNKNSVVAETVEADESVSIAQRIAECVNAMDGIREPIEFMDCVLDTMEHVKIMMNSNGLNETRKGIYQDVCATIDDLQRNKNLPCNNS